MSIELGDQNLKFLYKYRPLADDSCDCKINKNTLRLLENGELFFSKPSDFNDAFDSKIEYDTSVSSAEITKYLCEQGVDEGVIYNIIGQINQGTLSVSDIISSNGSGYADSLKILCLSKTEKNILMWSHYAKDHTGICVGIKVHFYGNSLNIKVPSGHVLPRTDGLSRNLIPALHVKYKDDKPTSVNIFR